MRIRNLLVLTALVACLITACGKKNENNTNIDSNSNKSNKNDNDTTKPALTVESYCAAYTPMHAEFGKCVGRFAPNEPVPPVSTTADCVKFMGKSMAEKLCTMAELAKSLELTPKALKACNDSADFTQYRAAAGKIMSPDSSGISLKCFAALGGARPPPEQ